MLFWLWLREPLPLQVALVPGRRVAEERAMEISSALQHDTAVGTLITPRSVGVLTPRSVSYLGDQGLSRLTQRRSALSCSFVERTVQYSTPPRRQGVRTPRDPTLATG